MPSASVMRHLVPFRAWVSASLGLPAALLLTGSPARAVTPPASVVKHPIVSLVTMGSEGWIERVANRRTSYAKHGPTLASTPPWSSDTPSLASWLHPLKSRSLRKSRGGSVECETLHHPPLRHAHFVSVNRTSRREPSGLRRSPHGLVYRRCITVWTVTALWVVAHPDVVEHIAPCYRKLDPCTNARDFPIRRLRSGALPAACEHEDVSSLRCCQRCSP